AHLLSTQFLWQDRVAHRPLSTPFWPEWDVKECAVRLDLARAGWRNFLRGLDSAALDTTIRYVNTKGSYYTSTVGDVISHVLFHGAHHRGQVAAALRAAGAEPPTTDFIHAVRTGVLGPGGD
ncbi:MAG: DinB family protein, partial [Planctomycetota bacterium]